MLVRARTRHLAIGLLLSQLVLIGWSRASCAGILPLPIEHDGWSDMAFPGAVSGSYNAANNTLTLSASPSNDLELGSEFGPSNIGRHYGNGGTLGGAFAATMNLTGVVIENDGSVSNGGTLSVVYNGPPAGSSNLAEDYGIGVGATLLAGSVLEVLLDATGDNTLDILFKISGGVLQNVNPALDTNFAPNGRGLFRMSGVATPSNFTGSFSLEGSFINFHGIPEPEGVLLGMLATGLAASSRIPRRLNQNRKSPYAISAEGYEPLAHRKRVFPCA
jgi:hypothetical protein